MISLIIIVGESGTVTKKFEMWLEKIKVRRSIAGLKKACLLGTARIIRKVLDT